MPQPPLPCHFGPGPAEVTATDTTATRAMIIALANVFFMIALPCTLRVKTGASRVQASYPTSRPANVEERPR
jgi:hypothetical protein